MCTRPAAHPQMQACSTDRLFCLPACTAPPNYPPQIPTLKISLIQIFRAHLWQKIHESIVRAVPPASVPRHVAAHLAYFFCFCRGTRRAFSWQAPSAHPCVWPPAQLHLSSNLMRWTCARCFDEAPDTNDLLDPPTPNGIIDPQNR